MEKFYFGMETLRVTQNYNSKISHYNHSHGTPKDYPIDVAGIDTGQSAYFLPVDMKVVAIKGVGTTVTNTIWLETTEVVATPSFENYVWLTLTHWNSSSKTANYKAGDIIKKGEIIAYEGTDGASSNHLHVTCGRGKCSSWIQNSKGAWIMNGESLPPEKVMYVNKNHTRIVSGGGLKWIDMPTIEYFKKCNSNHNSIVDALKSIDVDSSFNYRTKIARSNSIKFYLGTARQNINLLNLLKNGKLIQP